MSKPGANLAELAKEHEARMAELRRQYEIANDPLEAFLNKPVVKEMLDRMREEADTRIALQRSQKAYYDAKLAKQ